MPRRDDSNVSHEQGAYAPPMRTSNPSVQSADTWDEIMNMKSGGSGEEGGFNKMNTNFFLTDNEEIEIVLFDDVPTMFWGHIIKCKSKDSKTFYRTEQCQKTEQDYCTLCSSNNPAVSKAKKIIAFRLLDSRGSWDSKAGGLDGIPIPKIFLAPLYLAKQFKTLLDEAGGTLKDKVLKLSKKTQYMVSFKFDKLPSGGFDYVKAPEYDGELPDILDIYAPMTDADLSDFIMKFADNAPANAKKDDRSSSVGRSGGQGGRFN